MNTIQHAPNRLPPQTHVSSGFIVHYTVNTKIEQIANVHEIPCHVHEMFIIYRLNNLLPTRAK